MARRLLLPHRSFTVKKIGQQLAALNVQDPADDFALMVQALVVEQLIHGRHATAFGFAGCIDDLRDASLQDCSRAHDARF